MNIHLNSPVLSAELKVDSHTELSRPLAGLAAVPTEPLAIASQKIAELDGEPGALDVATLPRTDGEGVSLHRHHVAAYGRKAGVRRAAPRARHAKRSTACRTAG